MSEKVEKKGKALYRKFLGVFFLSTILFLIILSGVIATAYTIYGEEKIMSNLINFAPAFGLLAIAFVGISTANILWFKKHIISPLSAIENAIENLRRENYEKKIRLKTADEFQKIADAINLLTDKLNTFVQIEEEKKEMQNNLIKFLQLMTSVSEGDLTLKAEATPDVFGSLADAFNLMSYKIGEVIIESKKSADELGQKSQILSEIIQKLQNSMEIHKEEVEKISYFVEKTSDITTQTDEKIRTAMDISNESMSTVLKGSETVTETAKIMQLIKTIAQNINSKMKTLSEKLTEIETISTIINEIANRLDLLALNASIEAARAGEEGRGFTVIADEIKALSEKATRSSKHIENIIRLLHEEAKAITGGLEEEASYLGTVTDSVSQVVSVFDNIDSTIIKTEQIIKEINETLQKQKELVDENSAFAQRLKEPIDEISTMVNKIMDVSSLLSDTSKKLMEVTEGFKI